MKRKHYNEIIAYAEGKDIEYSLGNLRWKGCGKRPKFLDDRYYRVKVTPMSIPWEVIDPAFKFAIKIGEDRVFIASGPFHFNGRYWVAPEGGGIGIGHIISGIVLGTVESKDSMIERPKDPT